MEVIDGMTPEQLRAMADEMEGEGKLADNIRHVEVDGIALDIDMRRVSDLRTLRLIAKVQEGGPGLLAATLDLADIVLGDQRGIVEDALADPDGYIDAERYTEVFTKVFEAVGAKN